MLAFVMYKTQHWWNPSQPTVVVDTLVVRDTVKFPPQKIYIKGKTDTLVKIDSSAVDSLIAVSDSLKALYYLAQPFRIDTTFVFTKLDTLNKMNDTVWVKVAILAEPLKKSFNIEMDVRLAKQTVTIKETITVPEGHSFMDYLKDIATFVAGVLVGKIF